MGSGGLADQTAGADRTRRAALAVTVLVAVQTAGAGAQDFTNIDLNAVLAGQMAETQQRLNGVMQQAMQQRGPEIQAAYQRCLQSGGYCGSFEEYALNYVSTNGFTDGGAWARQNQINQQREQAGVQGLRQAEANRGAAQQVQRDSHLNNQQEAGRQLMGSSTSVAPNGAQRVLLHTWQANTDHEFQGNRYHVDPAGQYFVQGVDGWWYPLNR